MPSATIQTTKGDIVLDVHADDAPKASANFLELARKGFYDGVIFHRVVPGFVIQGGDPTGTGRGGPGYQFEDEPFSGDYVRGAVAMANAGPNTNGSQFFICLEDLSGRLPKNYTLFGHVTSGLDVVDAIASDPIGPGDRPRDPVAMTSVTVTDA
jgi:cyclophilin family peptidyl-prolyl cis-trans isomerase